MARRKSVLIGTSGWNYDHWKGPFYPGDLSRGDWLSFYCRNFATVEVNNSFYRLPSESSLRRWRDTVPESFVIAVKASRYITHMKKLKDPRQSLEKFVKRIRLLEGNLGPILFQLPPRWRCNPQRLESFLSALPEGNAYAFEFRDPSWFDPRTYDVLSSHEAAFCMYDLKGETSPKELTADFAYIRLHGPENRPYAGLYDTKALSGWAGAISAWLDQGLRVYCYFDNDQKGYAPRNAAELQQMLRPGGKNTENAEEI
jgi:uncharacterized protein YecE (DUF72 family)